MNNRGPEYRHKLPLINLLLIAIAVIEAGCTVIRPGDSVTLTQAVNGLNNAGARCTVPAGTNLVQDIVDRSSLGNFFNIGGCWISGNSPKIKPGK